LKDEFVQEITQTAHMPANVKAEWLHGPGLLRRLALFSGFASGSTKGGNIVPRKQITKGETRQGAGKQATDNSWHS
jgi:hypothetical protein